MFMLYRIQGATGVELASGLHWYLKYWCGAHISWDKTGGAQLASIPFPGSLPRVQGKGVKIERPVPWNYYQNVVTSSCESFLALNICFHNLCLIPNLLIS
jgi:alpha-N-acetylglucosaminidase